MTDKEQTKIFETWLEQYRALMFKVIRAYAFTPDERNDLFQEIALQIWRSVPAFRQESTVPTWIYRIALNVAIKWGQKERKQASRPPPDTKEWVLAANENGNDLLDWLYDEIQQLDKIDRSVALLLLDDFSYKEISAILGISVSHVGVKINRIKKYLVSKSKKSDSYGIR